MTAKWNKKRDAKAALDLKGKSEPIGSGASICWNAPRHELYKSGRTTWEYKCGEINGRAQIQCGSPSEGKTRAW